MFLGVELLSDVFWNVSMVTEVQTLLYVLDKAFEMVRLKLVMFLADWVAPTMGSQMARRTGTAHDIVDILPDRWLASHPLLGIKLGSPFSEHLPGYRP